MKNRRLWISIIAGILVGAMLLSLLASLFASNASATTSGELKDQLEALEQEKDAISQQLAELEKQQSSNYSDIEGIIQQKSVIDQQVALLYAEMENVNSQIAAYSLLIADKQAELEQAEKRLDELSKQNKERIRAMEEQGELSLWSVIFEANSFSDLLDRIEMIDEITRADRERLEEMSQVAKDVEQTRDSLTQEKAALELVRKNLEATQKLLDEKNAQADALLNELVAAAEDLDQLHSEFEQMEEDFLNEIAQTEQAYNEKLAEELESSRQASLKASIAASIEQSIAESVAESIAESKRKEESRRQEASRQEASRQEASRQEQTSKKPTGGNQGSSENPSGIIWRVPCSYVSITSPFGYRWHPVTGKWAMHDGIDMAGPKGTPIYASRSGTVTIAKYHATAGNYVTINHQDGYSSVYMHMTHYVVGVGEEVKAGQLIGYMGSTGRSTGSHLHFGITYNGQYVNPLDYIG